MAEEEPQKANTKSAESAVENEPTSDRLTELEVALASAQRESEEHKANWLRAQADYQNLRRRQLGDVEAAVRRAQSSLIENILLVLDCLDMALAIEVQGGEAKNLALGVKLTRDQLLQALEREEVRPIATSEKFDPALHEAVGTLESSQAAPGSILGVVRSGWTFRGQVLRPAHVRVATPPQG